MWLDGSKTNPTFNYTITEKNGKTFLLDEVKYTKRGKTKIIKGFDYLNPNNDMAFTWQGKGLLAIAKSHWEIKLIDEKNEWAVIWFSKTLFTPEGVDIISKKQKLDHSIMEEIKTKMQTDSVLKKHVSSLKDL